MIDRKEANKLVLQLAKLNINIVSYRIKEHWVLFNMCSLEDRGRADKAIKSGLLKNANISGILSLVITVG